MATATALKYPGTEFFDDDNLPESDGEPMAETDKHRKEMVNMIDGMCNFFEDSPDVYVTGNIFVYYRDARNRIRAVSPDVFFVRGVENRLRRIYKIWEEKTPELVIELTSRKTWREDRGKKRKTYARLGVKEYFLYDPCSEIFQPRLKGYRLVGSEYVRMREKPLISSVTGLELRLEEDNLRLYDPITGERLRTHKESESERKKAEFHRRLEAEMRCEAEMNLKETEMNLKEAETNLQKEALARQAGEKEIARLRDLLAESQGSR